MAPPTYFVEIDWSGNGVFTGTGEDVTSRVLGSVRHSRGLDLTQGFPLPAAAELRFTLDNTSGDYYPDNGSSPIAGLVKPGKIVQLRWTTPEFTDDKTFYGPITDLVFHPDPALPTVEVTATVGFGQFTNNPITLPTSVDDPPMAARNVNTFMGYVLDQVGWPSGTGDGQRSMSVSKSLASNVVTQNQSANEALIDLLRVEGPGAYMFIDYRGRFVFRDRHHRLINNNSLYTFSEDGAGAEFKYQAAAFTYFPNWESVINDAWITVEHRPANVRDSTDLIWSMPDVPVTLAAGETRTWLITHSDPWHFPTTPIAVYEGSPPQSTTYTTIDPFTQKLDITAPGAGSTTIFSFGTGGIDYPIASRLTYTEEDTTSQTDYGTRRQPFTIKYVNDSDADYYLDELILAHKEPQRVIHLTLKGSDASTPEVQRILLSQIGQFCTVKNTDMGLNDKFQIMSITVEITQAGLITSGTFGLLEATGTIGLGTALILDDTTDGKLDTGTLAF